MLTCELQNHINMTINVLGKNHSMGLRKCVKNRQNYKSMHIKKTELLLKSPLSTTYVPNFKAPAQKLTSWMLIKSMWPIWSLRAYLMRQNLRYRTCPRSLAHKYDWQSLKMIGKKCGREAANGNFGGRPPTPATTKPWSQIGCRVKTLIHSDILG